MNILICKTLQKAHKPCCYSDNSLLLKKSLKTAIAKLFERFSFFLFLGFVSSLIWRRQQFWSSDWSLAYYTYCGTRQPFIMAISEDQWHSHLLPYVLAVEVSLAVWTSYVFAAGIWKSNLSHARRTIEPAVPPSRRFSFKIYDLDIKPLVERNFILK